MLFGSQLTKIHEELSDKVEKERSKERKELDELLKLIGQDI